MVRNEFSFPSADGKTSIHAVEWLPEGASRAVLQIAHGVAEYILRYEPFAAYLTKRGFAVTGHDHIGHGSSAAPDAARLYFGPRGSWDYVTDDVYSLYGLTKKKFPKAPYFLLGHSMGSFIARTYLIRYPGTVDGAVLMGTGQMSAAMIAGGRAVAAGEARRMGEDRPSPVVQKLAFDPYNKPFAPNRTGFDWLSADTDNVDRYVADPLCGGAPTVGLFREMLRGMDFIARPAHLKRMNLNTPVLFISGAMDPVGGCGRGVKRAYESFLKAGVREVSLQLYPELRHEILNEACREKVFEDVYQWLAGRVPAAV